MSRARPGVRGALERETEGSLETSGHSSLLSRGTAHSITSSSPRRAAGESREEASSIRSVSGERAHGPGGDLESVTMRQGGEQGKLRAGIGDRAPEGHRKGQSAGGHCAG